MDSCSSDVVPSRFRNPSTLAVHSGFQSVLQVRSGRRLRSDKRLGAGIDGRLLLVLKSSLSVCDESLAGDGARSATARPVALCCTYDSVHNCDDRVAGLGDSAVGRFLSLAVPSFVGILLLLFGHQLFDGWLWGRYSPADLARPGPGGECSWHADVWHIGERSVHYHYPPRRRTAPFFNAFKNSARFDSRFQAGT